MVKYFRFSFSVFSSYYVHRFVCIIFFSFFRHCSVFNFLSPFLESKSFCELLFFAIGSYRFLRRTFVVMVPIRCITRWVFSFFRFFFRTRFIFRFRFFVYRFSVKCFSIVDKSASGCYSVRFFSIVCFSCTCSTVFCTSESFSFINLSRNFLSVSDVIVFVMSRLLLKSSWWKSSSNWVIFLIDFPVSPNLIVMTKKFREVVLFFFWVDNICCRAWVVYHFDFVRIGFVIGSCYLVRCFGFHCSRKILDVSFFGF